MQSRFLGAEARSEDKKMVAFRNDKADGGPFRNDKVANFGG